MTEQELRALVRDAVARHRPGGGEPLARRSGEHSERFVEAGPLAPSRHPSHAQYLTLINVGDSCLIEPAVECTHCGYCKSHGH